MSKIFHIITKNQWQKAKQEGEYSPSSLVSDGFIHCSKADQLLNVANSFFKDNKQLLILKINTLKLNSLLKIEPPREAPMSKVLFPHIYGPLNIEAVEGEFSFSCKSDGYFILPTDLLS